MKLCRCACGYPATMYEIRSLLELKFYVVCAAGHKGGERHSLKEAARVWNRAQRTEEKR